MTPEERKEAVTKAAKRILKNLDAMDEEAKLAYVEKLVDQFDEMHLIAWNFAVEMTPERAEEGQE